jgi:hypothetical protein
MLYLIVGIYKIWAVKVHSCSCSHDDDDDDDDDDDMFYVSERKMDCMLYSLMLERSMQNHNLN